MKIVKHTVLLFYLFFIGCATSLMVSSKGIVSVTDKTYDEVFSIVMMTATESNLTLIDVNKSSGFILATMPRNPLLTWQSPAVNITVIQVDNKIQVNVQATIGGQMVDYGTTKNIIEDFCNKLQKNLPSATVKIL